MKKLVLTREPVAKAGMLIRRPVSEVFAAFVDPIITSKFWFTKSTGRLRVGTTTTWTWEQYGVSVQVRPTMIEENQRIVFEWGEPRDGELVELRFQPLGAHETYVAITNSNLPGEGDALMAKALDAVGGFTTLLDGAKAWLEHSLRLRLVEDKFPPNLRPD